MIENARHIRDAKKQIPNEVLVASIDPHTRDLVARHAINLAEAKGRDGKPNAGMRIEIPPFLGGTFKLMESHGHNLRHKYGPMLKRHVKFDDVELSMFLDVKLPNEEGWIRVTPDFAR